MLKLSIKLRRKIGRIRKIIEWTFWRRNELEKRYKTEWK
jgi:hypothetical protein